MGFVIVIFPIKKPNFKHTHTQNYSKTGKCKKQNKTNKQSDNEGWRTGKKDMAPVMIGIFWLLARGDPSLQNRDG